MRRKTISLSNELQLLLDATQGVRSLVQRWIDSFGMEAQIPEQISALLVLLAERLRLLDRATRGSVDPRLVWSPQNDQKLVPGDRAEASVTLTAWSDQQLARYHRKQWQRIRRRVAASGVTNETKETSR
jgi:hypothetical protein